MYCNKCGNLINDNSVVCPNCGCNVSNGDSLRGKATMPNERFLPSFILGLIASIFGMCGGLCVTMCTSFVGSGTAPFVLIFGGSILGLVGACKCLSDAKKGSIIELIAAVMIMICAFGITGGDIGTVLAMVLFLIGGLIGLISSFSKK